MNKSTLVRMKKEDRAERRPDQVTVDAISRVVGTDGREVRRFFDGFRDDIPPIRGLRATPNIDVSTLSDPSTNTVNVPLFVGVPASSREWTEEHPHGLYPADPRHRPTFAVRVVGKCMIPAMHPGDTVVASRAAWEGDGKRLVMDREYVVCLADGRMTLKVARPDSHARPGWFRLEPHSKDYMDEAWDEQYSNVAWAAKVVQVNKG